MADFNIFDILKEEQEKVEGPSVFKLMEEGLEEEDNVFQAIYGIEEKPKQKETKPKDEEEKEYVSKTAGKAPDKTISPYLSPTDTMEKASRPGPTREAAEMIGKPRTEAVLSDDLSHIEKFPLTVEERLEEFVRKHGNWFRPEEGSPGDIEIKRTVIDEDANWLQTFFKTNEYIDDPEVGMVKKFDYPYYAARFVNWFEKAGGGLLGGVMQATGWALDKVGADKAAGIAKAEAKKLYDTAQWSPIGEYVAETERKRAIAFSELPWYYRTTNKFNEQVTDFGALMATLGLFSGPTINPQIQSALNKVGATKAVQASRTLQNFIKSPKLARWATQVPKMGTFRFLSTPSESVKERASGAAWLMAYNSTPYVATWMGSKLPYVSRAFEFGKPMREMGIPVFVIDTVLNTAISSPQYVALAEQHGWWTPEFIEEAQSILTWDVLMSWGTRKWPAENRDMIRNQYADRMARRAFQMRDADSTKTIDDYKNDYRDMFARMDAIKPEVFPEIEANIILSDTSKVDFKLDDNGKMSSRDNQALNRAFGLDIKTDSPSRYLYEAEKSGAKMDRSNPNLHTPEVVKEHLNEVNRELAEASGRPVGEMGREYITERLNQKAVEIETKYDEMRKVAEVKDANVATKESQKFEQLYPKVERAMRNIYTETELKTINIREEGRKAIDYTEKYPQKALRVAYGFDDAPKTINPTALRLTMAESLRADGRVEQARMIEQLARATVRASAQEMNIAKLDPISGGTRKLEEIVIASRLEKIGKGLPKELEGDIVKRARKHITAAAKEAAKSITKYQAKIQTAQKLIDMLTC